MKRLAAVIISIVFIFTACGRHALEREAFSTAETEDEIFETKETENETSEPEENEQPRNEKSPWTTGSIIKWGFTGYITLYVVALAGIIIHINYYNKETYPEGIPQGGQKEQEIEKTYKILARIKPNIRLTVREILDRLRDVIPFNLEINNAVSINTLGDKNNGYSLWGTDFGISIYDCNVLSIGPLATIQDGSIIPKEHPVRLFETRTTTKHIKTLKITSESPENTRFLKKLIEITTDPPVEIPEEISEEEEEQERRPEEEEQERRPEEEEQPIITDSDSDYSSSSV